MPFGATFGIGGARATLATLEVCDGGRGGGERICAGWAKKLFASLLLMLFIGAVLDALFDTGGSDGVPRSSGAMSLRLLAGHDADGA